MSKKEKEDIRLDKNSMSYIPTYEELGYSEAEMIKDRDEQQMMFFEKEYDRRTLQFQERHRDKVRQKQAQRTAKKQDRLLNHWFLTLDQSVIKRLVDGTRQSSDDVIDHIQSTEKIQGLRVYNEDLRIRVKHGIFIYKPASFDKLRRFPNYDPINEWLYGSPSAMYRLWTHCFPSPKKLGNARQVVGASIK